MSPGDILNENQGAPYFGSALIMWKWVESSTLLGFWDFPVKIAYIHRWDILLLAER